MISGNAINHLASADHLKNLKSFLWKYGGKMDQVDSFRISEEDLAKVLTFRYHAVMVLGIYFVLWLSCLFHSAYFASNECVVFGWLLRDVAQTRCVL